MAVEQTPFEAPPPRTSEELLLEANATAEDRRLVIRLVEVHMRNEEAEKGRLRQKNPARRHKYSNEQVKFSECERILMAANIGWRRQVRLMSASIALARESGVAFRYSRTGTLARSLEREESA